jgi:hypothetical protein
MRYGSDPEEAIIWADLNRPPNLIAKDSILSPLTKLWVQIAATIAVSSFRRSARRDETLSFRIKRAAIWPVRLILARLDRRPANGRWLLETRG